MAKIPEEVLLGMIANAGGGGGGGTSNYNDLSNKPQIGGVTLSGNKSASDLGLADDDTVQGILDGQVIDSFSDVETALESKADADDVKKEFIGTTEEWNALSTAEKKEYDTYQITDDFISGGGSGFTKDLLYSNETTTELPSSVTLLKSWKDYDALAVCFESVYQNRLYVQSSIILKEYLEIALDTSYSNGGFVPLGNTESGAYLFGKIASETEISNIYGTVLRLGTIYGLKFGSGSGSGGDGLQLYHETYTGTGTAVHVLSLQHTPVLITSLGRADGKVMISPFSPKGLAARVDWIIPNTGNGTVGISEDNGVKITGIDAGQACNTEDIEYDVYYLA